MKSLPPIRTPGNICAPLHASTDSASPRADLTSPCKMGGHVLSRGVTAYGGPCRGFAVRPAWKPVPWPPFLLSRLRLNKESPDISIELRLLDRCTEIYTTPQA